MNLYDPHAARWWRDGLIWSCIGLVALGILIGVAVGTVVAW